LGPDLYSSLSWFPTFVTCSRENLADLGSLSLAPSAAPPLERGEEKKCLSEISYIDPRLILLF